MHELRRTCANVPGTETVRDRDLYTTSLPNDRNLTTPDALPITAHLPQIIELVQNNQFTVIHAETGAGKSTQVTKALLQAGYNIVIAEPRRIAARTLATRVADELGSRLGDVVGYRTAIEHIDSFNTRLMFCTDGLALVRELMGHGKAKDILILDDIHDWNLNTEVLLAWAKHEINSGEKFKVITMSATTELEILEKFLGNPAYIKVPGRQYKITEQPKGSDMLSDVVNLLKDWRDVLVFLPGKVAINKFIQGLQRSGVSAELIPLHSELDWREQQLCYRSYGKPKCVLATNYAQSSITIPGISAVVDSGLENRIETVGGVEGLYTRPISLSAREQRKGRAGRVEDGIYIDHCPVPMETRLIRTKPEIERLRSDQIMLRLAALGVDMAEFEFAHQPPARLLEQSRTSLCALGCLTENGTITELGRKVALLPVAANLACMLVEAEKRGVLGDVLDIVAILEVGGILNPDQFREHFKLAKSSHRSDVFVELAAYRKAFATFSRDRDITSCAVQPHKFLKALEISKLLKNALRDKVNSFGSTNNKVEIIKSLCRGMVDHVYEYIGNGQYYDGQASRGIAKHSSVCGAAWIIAMPFDADLNDCANGRSKKSVLAHATEIDPMYLCEVAAHLIKRVGYTQACFDPQTDRVVVSNRITFRDRVIQNEVKEVQTSDSSNEAVALWLAQSITCSDSQMAARPEQLNGFSGSIRQIMLENRERFQSAHCLNLDANKQIFNLPDLDQLKEHFLRALNGASRLRDVFNPELFRLQLDVGNISQLREQHCPSFISLGDRDYPVKYNSGKPWVALSADAQTFALLKSLHELEITLADGRPVELALMTIVKNRQALLQLSRNPKVLLEALDQLSAQNAFSSWDQFELPYPDINDPDVKYPGVKKIEISRSPFSGEPIYAYGIVLFYYINQSQQFAFKTKWYMSEVQATMKVTSLAANYHKLRSAIQMRPEL